MKIERVITHKNSVFKIDDIIKFRLNGYGKFYVGRICSIDDDRKEIIIDSSTNFNSNLMTVDVERLSDVTIFEKAPTKLYDLIFG